MLKCEVSLQLNGLLISDGAPRMLEVKDYQCINVVFPFICKYVIKATGNIKDAKLKKVNTRYSELLLE